MIVNYFGMEVDVPMDTKTLVVMRVRGVKTLLAFNGLGVCFDYENKRWIKQFTNNEDYFTNVNDKINPSQFHMLQSIKPSKSKVSI
jgi:hypothetical protein